MNRFLDAFKDWAEVILDNLKQFGNYLIHDEGFVLASADVARYIFIVTSVLLVLVMVIARPRRFLDVMLTLREFMLSFIFIVSIVARWEGWRLPQWFIVGELHLVSLVGVLLIWALVREYLWTYIESRKK